MAPISEPKKTDRLARYILLIPVIILVAGISCTGKTSHSRTVFPDIVSTGIQLNMDSLAEDVHFFGEWGGPMYDHHDYRPLHGEGGGIRFDLSAIEPLLGKISLRSDQDQDLVITCNGIPVKRVSIPRKQRSSISFLVSAKRLHRLDNLLEIRKSRADIPLRIEAINLTSKKLLFQEPDRTLLPLPALLRLSVFAKEGEILEISSPHKLDKIRMSISRDSEPVSQYEQSLTTQLAIALPPGGSSPLGIEIECISQELAVPMPEVRLISPARDHRSTELREIARGLAENKKTWNILVLLLDSARADRLGSYGYPRPTSPNIDRLAASSLVYSRFTSEAAYTLASTATLMTGLAPDSHNVLSDYYGGLNGKLVTLAESFSQKGYFCAAVSAIPYCGKSFAMDQGFDDFTELFQREPQVKAPTFIPELDRLVNLSRERKQPFFIYMHIREPHIDYLMPPPYYKTFRRTFLDLPDDQYPKIIKNLYFGQGEWKTRSPSENEMLLLGDSYDENLLSADATIGEILNRLKQHSISTNTIVVLLGDHGEGLGEHKLIGHNVVLFREGVTVPLIIHIPGLTPHSVVNDLPFSTSDLTHTLKTLIGDRVHTLADSGIFATMGRRFKVARTIFFNRFYPHFVVEEGPYRAHMVFPMSKGGHRIYNVVEDPGETIPLDDPKLLAHFSFQIRQHLRHSLLTRSVATKSTTTEYERKILESLGYL